MLKDRLWNELQEGYRQFLLSYPYEIMVTIHFGKMRFREETANKVLKQFMTKVAKYSKTQIACIGIYNILKSPHAHLLIFGKKGTLRSLLKKDIDKLWRYGSVHINPNTDEGAAFYVATNVTPHLQDRYELFFYNLRMLKKHRMEMFGNGKRFHSTQCS